MKPIDKMKESKLLKRLKKGDHSSFTEAYDLLAPKLYRHAFFRVSSHEIAEDIMGQTFLKAWESVSKNPKEIENLKAFLYRICNNLIIDYYRSKVRTNIGMTEEVERTLSSDEDIEAFTDGIIAKEKMHEALETLKDETRELIVMRYIDELSIEEIAAIQGKTKNSLYVALHRAIKELKLVCST